MSGKLPENARRLSLADSSINELFRRLERYHGISPVIAGERIHRLKRQLGRGAADNLLFDLTGNAYDPDTLEHVGSLTEEGAK
jgi:hypothetical protein